MNKSPRTNRTYYLHTLNGSPAVYVRGQGVCFASFYGRPNKLARSLKQIRAEQEASKARDAARVNDTGEWTYSYVRVTP